MSQRLFGLTLFLLLVSHASAAGGPFAWLPIPLPAAVSHLGWQIGVLLLLPVLVVISWWLEETAHRLKRENNKPASSRHPKTKGGWTWGETAVTLPLAALSGLVLLRLRPETVYLGAMLALGWFVYLYLANHPTWQQNRLWRVLAVVLLVQGTVALAQFLLQRELGLAWLGEPALDLLVEGTSVAERNGQNWLRAYGLNSHPNQLGLLLMALCLLIWPNRHQANRWWRWLFCLDLIAGVVGLLVSLSRSAWVGLLLGGLVYAVHRRGKGPLHRREFALPLAILAAGVLLFALAYGDVMAGRLLGLDSPLESRSLWERQRDLGLAWQLLRERPFLGVGLGQYLAAATVLDPAAAQVHNVPLLIGAELGVVGLVLWLIFWLWPLWRYGRLASFAPATAVWVGLILMALVHPEPSLALPKGAVLWGVAAAQWVSPLHPSTPAPQLKQESRS